MKTKCYFIAITILTIIIFSACEDTPQICDPTPQFSIDEFVNQIETRLESQNIVGYQFAVNQQGNLYHEQSIGLGRHQNDSGGPVYLSAAHRFNVASVSKFVGTIALLNAMEDNNVSLEFKVSDYLPDSWRSQVHSLYNDVNSDAYLTFRKLLTNRTSIDFPGSTPAPGSMQTELQMLQALRSTPDLSRDGVYQNGNFTLIRVLIGEIVYDLDETASNYSTECTDKYFEYIDEHIFSKLDLNCPKSADEVNSYYNNSAYPLAYQYPFNDNFQNATDGSLGWAHTNNPYLNGGSGGLVLSALDIAEIMAYFKHDNTETIISAQQRNSILNSELGLTESSTGNHGRYQSKGGTRGPDDCCSRAIRSRMTFFPNDVEAVIITNSNHTSLGTLLRQAYDASWINLCD